VRTYTNRSREYVHNIFYKPTTKQVKTFGTHILDMPLVGDPRLNGKP
jgi:hypothetical protein